MSRRRRWFSALLPVVLYGAVIVYLSSRSELPSPGFKLWDKAAHFIEYTVLGGLVARAFHLIRGWGGARSAVAAVFLATAFAVTDEAHQFFVPGRDSDPWDVVADFLGCIFGGALYAAWLRLYYRFSVGAAPSGS